MSMLVCTGCQTGLEKFVQASTTTERFVAQEMVKPKWLVRTPKAEPLLKIMGLGKYH